jgi:hypothetical protein
VVGSARLKQIRAENDGCSPADGFDDFVNFCYPSNFDVDKKSFGPGSDAFTWRDDSEEYSFNGKFDHRRYPAGGFYVDLPLGDRTDVEDTIDDLRDNLWIDRKTRVVVLTFAVYNPNVNLLGSVRVIFEIMASGDVFPTAEVTAVQAEKYANTGDALQSVFELFCIVYIAIEFFYREVTEIIHEIRQGQFISGYLFQQWNYYEWSIIGLAAAITLLRLTILGSLGTTDYEPNGPFVNFSWIGDMVEVDRAMLSVLVIMCYMRGLKLLRIPPYTGAVTQSIMDVSVFNSVLWI